MHCGGHVVRVPFDLYSQPQSRRSVQLLAAQCGPERDPGNDCRGARTEADSQRNLVVDLQAGARQFHLQMGGAALHRL